MSTKFVSPSDFFSLEKQEATLSLIACPGSEELAQQIDRHLVHWAKEAGIQQDTFLVPCDCPRFQSGDAKGLVKSFDATESTAEIAGEILKILESAK